MRARRFGGKSDLRWADARAVRPDRDRGHWPGNEARPVLCLRARAACAPRPRDAAATYPGLALPRELSRNSGNMAVGRTPPPKARLGHLRGASRICLLSTKVAPSRTRQHEVIA